MGRTLSPRLGARAPQLPDVPASRVGSRSTPTLAPAPAAFVFSLPDLLIGPGSLAGAPAVVPVQAGGSLAGKDSSSACSRGPKGTGASASCSWLAGSPGRLAMV
jgi:hypothetical protein